nr:hypothetical protein [Tanacetum cinerariifolium]
MDDTDSGLFKRRNSPRRQEGGKKAPPQGLTIRINRGNSLQAVVPYTVVKMRWTAPGGPLTPITAPWPFYKWGIDIAGPFSEGPGNVKFLIVAMDYFTKWIEAKAVATITGGQSNGLVERANRSLGEGIKSRLGEGNKNWVEELPHVLWAHRTMINSSHGDTHFSLTYGTEAVIPTEIGMPTYRTTAVDVSRSSGWEARSEVGSNDASHAVAGGKLGPKWEGPYEVTEALGDGAYKLRSIDGTTLPRTWNIANLKRCYL